MDFEEIFRDDLITFSCEDPAVFKEKAKQLSLACGLPLTRAQETLARIHGHADYEAAIAAATAVERGEAEPGPYVNVGPKLTTRTLECVAKAHGASLASAPRTIWNSTKLGLFAPPAQARIAAKIMQAKTGALAKKATTSKKPKAAEYVRAIVRTTYGEAAIAFTALGRGVKDAVDETMADFHEGRTNFLEFRTAMNRISQRHPENPWETAAWTVTTADCWGHGRWTSQAEPPLFERRTLEQGALGAPAGPATSEGPSRDGRDPARTCGRSADGSRIVLEDAERAVATFEAIYDGASPLAPINILMDFGGIEGGDTRTYPQLLYTAACLALDIGERPKARPWLETLLSIPDGDRFGARHLLATVKLNDGEPLDDLCPDDGWPWAVWANGFDAFAEGGRRARANGGAPDGRDAEDAAMTLHDMIMATPMSIRALHPSYAGCDEVRETLLGALTQLREFLHRTGPFQEANPAIIGWISRATADPAIQEAAEAAHRKERRFGNETDHALLDAAGAWCARHPIACRIGEHGDSDDESEDADDGEAGSDVMRDGNPAIPASAGEFMGMHAGALSQAIAIDARYVEELVDDLYARKPPKVDAIAAQGRFEAACHAFDDLNGLGSRRGLALSKALAEGFAAIAAAAGDKDARSPLSFPITLAPGRKGAKRTAAETVAAALGDLFVEAMADECVAQTAAGVDEDAAWRRGEQGHCAIICRMRHPLEADAVLALWDDDLMAAMVRHWCGMKPRGDDRDRDAQEKRAHRLLAEYGLTTIPGEAWHPFETLRTPEEEADLLGALSQSALAALAVLADAFRPWLAARKGVDVGKFIELMTFTPPAALRLSDKEELCRAGILKTLSQTTAVDEGDGRGLVVPDGAPETLVWHITPRGAAAIGRRDEIAKTKKKPAFSIEEA